MCLLVFLRKASGGAVKEYQVELCGRLRIKDRVRRLSE